MSEGEEICRWQSLGTFLLRSGPRNAFNAQPQSGQAASSLGELCGQRPENPRFEGQPWVTSSDNAAHHLGRNPQATPAQPRYGADRGMDDQRAAGFLLRSRKERRG
jgi:hypothetical protein